ncbi:hypothetical protein BJ741DRAFT_708717 [Chytriomyces cf. hyalinus JEL632]|nr:hypothetical protein BJ741DRAFT_708717 [Chytriomyces cf. hyalinus JEL632]
MSKKITLAAILRNETSAPYSLADFRSYLEKVEYSVENLDFWEQCIAYRRKFRAPAVPEMPTSSAYILGSSISSNGGVSRQPERSPAASKRPSALRNMELKMDTSLPILSQPSHSTSAPEEISVSKSAHSLACPSICDNSKAVKASQTIKYSFEDLLQKADSDGADSKSALNTVTAGSKKPQATAEMNDTSASTPPMNQSSHIINVEEYEPSHPLTRSKSLKEYTKSPFEGNVALMPALPNDHTTKIPKRNALASLGSLVHINMGGGGGGAPVGSFWSVHSINRSTGSLGGTVGSLTDNDKRKALNSILSKYFTIAGPSEVNIPNAVYERLAIAVRDAENYHPNVLKEAMEEVYIMMKSSSFPRFMLHTSGRKPYRLASDRHETATMAPSIDNLNKSSKRLQSV